MKDCIEIMGKDSCPYCIKAKELAEEYKDKGLIDDVSYTDLEIESYLIDGLKSHGIYRVPAVFIVKVVGPDLEWDHIGGYDELEKYLKILEEGEET